MGRVPGKGRLRVRLGGEGLISFRKDKLLDETLELAKDRIQLTPPASARRAIIRPGPEAPGPKARYCQQGTGPKAHSPDEDKAKTRKMNFRASNLMIGLRPKPSLRSV